MFANHISQYQNIDTKENYADDHIADYLTQLQLPQKLPEINPNDFNDNDNDNNQYRIVNEYSLNILIENIKNILNEMPKYQLPPLFNDYNNLDDKTKINLSKIIDRYSMDTELQQQQQQQQQPQQSPSAIVSIQRQLEQLGNEIGQLKNIDDNQNLQQSSYIISIRGQLNQLKNEINRQLESIDDDKKSQQQQQP